MKRTLSLTSVLCALTILASCQKEHLIDTPASATGVTEFTATIELATKTSISPDGKVTWVEGDRITVTDAAEPANSAVYVAMSSGASTTFSYESGTAVTTPPYKATYGDYENQVYSEIGANCPLAAESETSNFTFSCPWAVLKITATSEVEKTIKEVRIFYGSSSLNSLDCSKETESVILSTEPKVFYIAMGADSYESLKITFTTTDELPEEATRTRNSSVELKAGDLLPLTLSFDKDDWNQSSCIAAGTMITMKNGELKAVEELEIGDEIRTVDHKTGTVSSAPICFIWKNENVSNAFTLTFEGGTDVTVIEEHGFYDREERKYAFINANNAKDYIGHYFYDADNDRWLELKSCKMLDKRVDAYAIVTSGHLNHLSNGLLSMCDGSIKVLANIFKYDSQLRFDAEEKAADIAAYGLTPLEKILEYKGFTMADYYDYNLQYLNVAIGKGLTSWDFVKALSDYCEDNQIY